LVLFLGSGYFLFWWNILGPVGHVTGSCLFKFSERPTVIVDTHDTIFSLCSWSPYHIFKFKCTARILRRSTYVLFTLPQLSWQPNPFVICALFYPQGVAVVVSRPVSFLREVSPESNAMASNLALRRHITLSVWSRTVGKEEGLFSCRTKNVVSRISVT